MPWVHNTAIVSAELREPWGNVILYPNGDRFGGCVRNWQGYPQRDIIADSLRSAKLMARTELKKLKSVYEDWNKRFGK